MPPPRRPARAVLVGSRPETPASHALSGTTYARDGPSRGHVHRPNSTTRKERSMRTHRIAAIGGDGIGPEVIAAGLQALDVCAERDGGFEFEVEHFDWG